MLWKCSFKIGHHCHSYPSSNTTTTFILPHRGCGVAMDWDSMRPRAGWVFTSVIWLMILSSHKTRVGKVELVTVTSMTLLRTLGPREEGSHREPVAGATLDLLPSHSGLVFSMHHPPYPQVGELSASLPLPSFALDQPPIHTAGLGTWRGDWLRPRMPNVQSA